MYLCAKGLDKIVLSEWLVDCWDCSTVINRLVNVYTFMKDIKIHAMHISYT